MDIIEKRQNARFRRSASAVGCCGADRTPLEQAQLFARATVLVQGVTHQELTKSEARHVTRLQMQE